MEPIIKDLQQLYKNRDIKGIDPFIEKYVEENDSLVISGTCCGELMFGRSGLKDILESDFKWWNDLNIFDEYEVEEKNGYSLYTLHAYSVFRVKEDEAYYKELFEQYDEIIADKKITNVQKALNISYDLDSVLSSRDSRNRAENQPVTVLLLVKDKKLKYINYYFNIGIEQVNSILHMTEEMDTYYQEESEQMKGEDHPEIQHAIEKLGYHEVKVKVIGNTFFYALGLVNLDNDLEKRLQDTFDHYKKEDSYVSLYQLRLRIGYLLEIYYMQKNPEAIVNFYGFVDQLDDIHINYSNYMYIESK